MSVGAAGIRDEIEKYYATEEGLMFARPFQRGKSTQGHCGHGSRVTGAFRSSRLVVVVVREGRRRGGSLKRSFLWSQTRRI